MDKITNLEELLQTHRVAINIKEVWEVIKTEAMLENVYVRSLWHDNFYPLSEIISNPFVFTGKHEREELGANDLLNNGEVAFLRIVGTAEKSGTVEIKNKHHKDWFRPEMDGLRIYIPF